MRSSGVALTIVPLDIAESGYWEMTVEKVVIQEASHHALKVVERREVLLGAASLYRVVRHKASTGGEAESKQPEQEQAKCRNYRK